MEHHRRIIATQWQIKFTNTKETDIKAFVLHIGSVTEAIDVTLALRASIFFFSFPVSIAFSLLKVKVDRTKILL
jgi:hypothetical protein